MHTRLIVHLALPCSAPESLSLSVSLHLPLCARAVLEIQEHHGAGIAAALQRPRAGPASGSCPGLTVVPAGQRLASASARPNPVRLRAVNTQKRPAETTEQVDDIDLNMRCESLCLELAAGHSQSLSRTPCRSHPQVRPEDAGSLLCLAIATHHHEAQ